MPDVITIALRFSVDTSLGPFQDTLYFTEDEWAKRDEAAIAARKRSIADAWVNFRSAQIAEEETMRTADGKRERVAVINEQIAELTAAKDAIEARL